jgi:DNA-binding NarL/FixJ family response regulator
VKSSLAAAQETSATSVAFVARIAVWRELFAAAINSTDKPFALAACVRSPEDAIPLLQGEKVDVVAVQAVDAAADMTSVGKLVRRIRVPVVVFGVPADPRDVRGWMRVGVASCLTQECSLNEILTALSLVSRGSSLSPVGSRAMQLTNGSLQLPQTTDSLTQREAEVVAHVGDGMSNKQIADSLSISVSTVKNHLHNAFVKLGVHGRVELFRADDGQLDIVPASPWRGR